MMWTKGLSESVVYADLSDLGLIGVRGNDVELFLQGQLTNDVRKLANSEVQYNGMCTPKGRLLASFLMWRRAGEWFIQLPAHLQESIQKRLTMYVLRAQVSLSDVREQWVRIGLAGSGAEALIARLSVSVPSAAMRSAENGFLDVLRLDQERFQLVVRKDMAETVLATLAQEASLIDAAQWQWLEIQAGIPSIVSATQEQFVPQMVNFDLIQGIDFKKGCYTGQEIVARMHYLGKLKRRMYGVHSQMPMTPGDEIFSPDVPGQATGMIVNAQPAPAGGWDALAVIQVSSALGYPLSLKVVDGELLSLWNLPYAVTVPNA
jgi:hypothetical protein